MDKTQPDGGAEASVRKWLASQGYPLEMRTARAMRKAGLAVRCSDYYIDPETGKARELDVAASRNVAIGEMLNSEVCALIECKAAKSGQQWVGFRSDVAESPALVPRVASRQGRRWLELLRFKIVPGEIAVPLLQQSPPQVHGLVATWQNGADEQRDTAYNAVKAAAHAAEAQRIRWAEMYSSGRTIVGVALPVVVFSGELFTARLDEASEIEVERADHVQVAWREPLSDSSLTLVDVVTEAALPSFCADLFQTAETLCVDHVAEARQAEADTGPCVQVF